MIWPILAFTFFVGIPALIGILDRVAVILATVLVMLIDPRGKIK